MCNHPNLSLAMGVHKCWEKDKYFLFLPRPQPWVTDFSSWEGKALSPPVLTSPMGQRKHRGLLRMPRDHSTGPRFIYKIINQLANDPFAFVFYLRGRRPASPNPMADHWDSNFALQTHWSYLSERSRCFTVPAVVTGLFAIRTRVRFKLSGRT